jgi:ADP-heptose:LPS heptosyltransferase
VTTLRRLDREAQQAGQNVRVPMIELSPIPQLIAEGIAGVPLPAGVRPERIVAVRLHAFGDVVITLPALAGLRRAMPDSKIEMVTSESLRNLVMATGLFDRVWGLPMERSRTERGLALLRLLTVLGRPDLLLDLQRSRLSTGLRRLLRPPAWVEFDRFAPRSALDRTLDALRWVGLGDIGPHYGFGKSEATRARSLALLGPAASEIAGPLVCLNPSGCWPTKNWPVDRYIELGRRMIEQWRAGIVLVGTGNVADAAGAIARGLDGSVIDLVGKTTAAQAFAVIRELDLVVSDDSGLMHLAWVSGVPTVGMFGATRLVWSRPMGEHSVSFGSEDLPYGVCMQPVCARGDLLCLQRRTTDEVFAACEALLRRFRPATFATG